jgi:LysM repeat protein
MDTLSRDSNSSGSILPLVGVIAGGLALVLSIVALVKITKVDNRVTGHDDAIAKIPAIESSVTAASAKADSDIRGLRTGIQTALDQVGNEIGTINAKIAKIEEAAKKPAPAPAAGGKAGAAAAPTGVLNADGTYTVAAGDTISKIARKFNVKVDSIEAENPGLDPAKLRAGQKIRIPKR